MKNFHAYLNSLSRAEKSFISSAFMYLSNYCTDIYRLDIASSHGHPSKVLFAKVNTFIIDKHTLYDSFIIEQSDYIPFWDSMHTSHDYDSGDIKPLYVYDDLDKEICELVKRYGNLLFHVSKDGGIMIL